MSELRFSEADLALMAEKHIETAQVIQQIQTFKTGIAPANLDRPCTITDGIIKLDEAALQRLKKRHQDAAAKGRMMKFVPASGAATRMFKLLLAILNQSDKLDAQQQAKIEQFLTNLPRFAFYHSLKTLLAKKGADIETLRAAGDYRPILAALLEPDGLNYRNLPKGLLEFHDYPNGSRTPFIEHLEEASAYAQGNDGKARIHFTISPEHEKAAKAHIAEALKPYEEKGVQFEISYSFQKPSTDTVAVNPDNTPFRDADGKLLFRPGGHGALLENLNELDGDIIFIKNIDNVVPDRLKETTYLYKSALAGLLVELQEKIFSNLEKLSGKTPDNDTLAEIVRFSTEALFIQLPDSLAEADAAAQAAYLFSCLNRPIRICGMVKNEGEPGGGPFWVIQEDDMITPQIVESSQVDTQNEQQRQIMAGATHFNPVDLICGVKNYRGESFDLIAFRDADTGFISEKSKDGKALKALELPGLWNGAMANWITVFVEVPILTFNPVKTVFDLLRPEHQPAGS